MKYYVGINTEIKEIEIERETVKTIIKKVGKHGYLQTYQKDSSNRHYRPTFEEAKQALLEESKATLIIYSRAIDKLLNDIQKIESLTEGD